MKTIFIFVLITFSQKTFTQDTLNMRHERARIAGITCIMSSPALILLASSNGKDVYGKVVFGLMSTVSFYFFSKCVYNSEKRKTISSTLFFLAGMSDGFAEELKYHYPNVHRAFPQLNDQFWNPEISWTNKYNSSIPFSKSLMVGATDGYHMTRSVNKIFLFSTSIFIDNKKSFKKNILSSIKYSILYSIGKGGVQFLIKNN